MQPDVQNEVKEAMNGKSAQSMGQAMPPSELMKTVSDTLSSSVSKVGVDFEKWSKLFVEKYDVAAGVSLAFGKRAFSLARRHPYYTAAGVFALGFLVAKTLRASSPKDSHNNRK
ncbi:MAG: hypothetical protein K2Q26_15540 [Bdellovibrionales bacterium]|nr:hypothetical protein [Bdellovibrionales bacterium]